MGQIKISGGVGVQGGQLVVDKDTSPAEVSISPSSIEHDEGQSGTTTYTYTASRVANPLLANTGLRGTVTYQVTGSGSNPAVGADFVGGVLPSGTITFVIGDEEEDIAIQVSGDTNPEPNKEFTVTLYADENTTIAPAAGTATGIITNDDDYEYTDILPQTAASIGGGLGWSNTDNVLEGISTDSNFASTGSSHSGSQVLRQTDYGMDIQNSSIDVLTVAVKGGRTSNNYGNKYVRLVQNGSVISSTKSVGTPGTTAENVFSGDSSYWGVSLTKEILSDPTFGVDVYFSNTTSNNNGAFYVYYSKISVTYV